MSQHAAVLTSFVQAVVLADRPLIQSLARPISEEPLTGTTGSGALSERTRLALPRDFFIEEIALGTMARQLATAAENADDDGIADRFAALARTCVACHTSYLHGRPGS